MDVDSLVFSEAEGAEYVCWLNSKNFTPDHKITDKDFSGLSDSLKAKILYIIQNQDILSQCNQTKTSDKKPKKNRSVRKSISKFWKKHKTEIIVASSIITVIGMVAAVAFATGGAAAGVALVAGGAALSGFKDAQDQDVPKISKKSGSPPSSPSISLPTDFVSIKKPTLPSPPPLDIHPPKWMPPSSVFNECPAGPVDALAFPKASFENEPPPLNVTSFGPPPVPVVEPSFIDRILPVFSSSDTNVSKSWPSWFFEMVGLKEEEPLPSPPKNNTSMIFTTKGERAPSMQIGGVNGMDTSLKEAIGHAEFLSKGAGGMAIDWVYNHSNTPVVDVMEVTALNMHGISPNTANLLKENWSAFHEQNKHNPMAKYLQFCHSQGAIHVKNALRSAPKEIRDRVIVVAIAPAAIVTDDICYQSFNYASKVDPVPQAELLVSGFFDPEETTSSARVQEVLANRGQLILLDPHPDGNGADHALQSPTFIELINKHLVNYCESRGVQK